MLGFLFSFLLIPVDELLELSSFVVPFTLWLVLFDSLIADLFFLPFSTFITESNTCLFPLRAVCLLISFDLLLPFLSQLLSFFYIGTLLLNYSVNFLIAAIFGTNLFRDIYGIIWFGEIDRSSDLCLKRLPCRDDRFREREVDCLWGVVKSGSLFYALLCMKFYFFAISYRIFGYSKPWASSKALSTLNAASNIYGISKFFTLPVWLLDAILFSIISSFKCVI